MTQATPGLRLRALADRKHWGAGLVAAARRRGIGAQLVESAAEVEDGATAFWRLAQHQPYLSQDREQAEELAGRGVTLIPDLRMLRHYEDKWAQAEAFADRFPETRLIGSADEARAVLDAFPLPFISKGRHGSGSRNVRLVKDRAAAEAEIALAFGPRGIPSALAPQRGYLIWQEFCDDNPHDYRAVVNGRAVMLLRRHNRKDRPMASGSGMVEPVNALAGEAAEVFEAARAFFAAHAMTWNGIDMVRDRAGRWRVLETTIAWTLKSYHGCRYHGDPKGRFGDKQWEVLLDGIEEGLFQLRSPRHAGQVA